MKTNVNVGDAAPKGGARGSGPEPKRDVGGRVLLGLLGFFILFLGLILVGAGYEEGPRKVEHGTPGSITVARCVKTGSHVECSGTFRSDDGSLRHHVTDFEAGDAYGKGEKAGAVALSSESFERSVPELYAEAAQYWCVSASMFGIALSLLSGAFRARKRSRRRSLYITGLVLLFGGLLGCGVCAVVSSLLA